MESLKYRWFRQAWVGATRQCVSGMTSETYKCLLQIVHLITGNSQQLVVDGCICIHHHMNTWHL